MKKIIDRKTYDTETAELLAESEHGYPSDLHHVCEGLYRTSKGALFLAGEGGASTKYAKACGQNHWSAGSNITPMTTEEAIDWCEENGETECVVKHFADQIEAA